MKKLLILSLLTIFHLGIYAQNEVFRIDSIPKQGVLLDKGWKFHAGDNPDFAKPEFDDSKWESIDPTKDIFEIPLPIDSTIGWFRTKFRINPFLLEKSLTLQINQNIASEIYVNGKLFKKYGFVSKNQDQVKAYYSFYEALPYKVSSSEQVFAIRFSIQKNLPYVNTSPKLGCFSVRINEAYNAYKSYDYYQRYVKFNYLEAGIFLLLALIHLSFYLVYKKQKANLYFFIASLGLSVGNIAGAFASYNSNDLSTKTYGLLIYYLFGLTFYNIFLFIAIHTLLKAKRGIYFWFLIVFSIFGFLILLTFQKWGYVFVIILSFLLCLTEALWLAIKSFRKGNHSIGIVAFGLSIYLILFGIFFGMIYGAIASPRISEYYVLEDLLYHISILCIPICISIYLSREYGFTSIKLEKQLVEVKQLSEEKQNTLLIKNAELQTALLKGQTIERQRVALDLHDNLGSTLSALWLSVDTIDKSKMNDEEKEIHQNLRENLEKAYNDVRLLSHNLLPKEFEKQGLTTILLGFVRKMNKNSTIKFDLKIDEDFGRVDNKIEFELYSICLELVNNIMKHSKASEAKIELSRSEKQIQLIVSDNGIGTFKNDSDGKGMKNVKARVESLNGVWDLASKENEGTNSTINIPI